MAQYTAYFKKWENSNHKMMNIFIFNDTHYETKHVKAFFLSNCILKPENKKIELIQ